jgi:hypothetical protein
LVFTDSTLPFLESYALTPCYNWNSAYSACIFSLDMQIDENLLRACIDLYVHECYIFIHVWQLLLWKKIKCIFDLQIYKLFFYTDDIVGWHYRSIKHFQYIFVVPEFLESNCNRTTDCQYFFCLKWWL